MDYYLGIDLGTFKFVTSSSSVKEPFVTTVDANALSNRSTPSIVTFDGCRRLVGEEAEARCMSLLSNSVIPAILPGERFNTPCGTDGALVGPFTFNGDDNLMQSRSQILAAILHHRLTMTPDSKPAHVTIAVPPSFTPENAAELMDACELCGIAEISSFIPASTAAITNYIHKESDKSGTFIFVDIGYSHTSVSLVNLTNAQRLAILEGVANDIDTSSVNVGVIDIIDALSAHVTKKVVVDPKSKKFARLRQASQKALTQLSMLPDGNVELANFFGDGDDLCAAVTRDALEAACLEISSRIKETVSSLVGDRKIDGVEVIGGGSRIPFIQKIISEATGFANLGRGLDGSSAVAVGAALVAAGKKIFPSITVDASLRSKSIEALKSQELIIRNVHENETRRLAVRNELEGYLYQVKDWLSSGNREKLNPAMVEPAMEKRFAWVEDNFDDETSLEVYTDKLSTFKSLVESNGRAFFDARTVTRDALDADLEKNARETVKPEKGELDLRVFSKPDRIRKSAKNKEEGNDMFKAGNLIEAVNRYNRAIYYGADIANLTEEEKIQVDATLLSCHLNLAQCLIKAAGLATGNDKDAFIRKALNSAESALSVDPKNNKGLYRKATCLEMQGKIEEAMKIAKDAISMNPDDEDFKKLVENLKKSEAKEAEKAKKVFSKMFS